MATKEYRAVISVDKSGAVTREYKSKKDGRWWDITQQAFSKAIKSSDYSVLVQVAASVDVKVVR